MYIRIGWKDHVVEFPRRYTSTEDSQGRRTDTPAPGTIIQQGTPQSATNFNQMDEGLQHQSIAFDELQVTMQAELRAAQDAIVDLQTAVAALADDDS